MSDRLSLIEQRIERAIQDGEDVLTATLGDPPNEEAWADLAGEVIGDLADDYRGAVDLFAEALDLAAEALDVPAGYARHLKHLREKLATLRGQS